METEKSGKEGKEANRKGEEVQKPPGDQVGLREEMVTPVYTTRVYVCLT